jgi:hypothetical protein
MNPDRTLPPGVVAEKYLRRVSARCALPRDGHAPLSPVGLNPVRFAVAPDGAIIQLVPPRPRLDLARLDRTENTMRAP